MFKSYAHFQKKIGNIKIVSCFISAIITGCLLGFMLFTLLPNSEQHQDVIYTFSLCGALFCYLIYALYFSTMSFVAEAFSRHVISLDAHDLHQAISSGQLSDDDVRLVRGFLIDQKWETELHALNEKLMAARLFG